MNWEQEIEIEGEGGIRVMATAGEIHNILMAALTRDEIEEFAGELIVAAASRMDGEGCSYGREDEEE